MEPWVVLSVGVAVAATISVKPLSRLSAPKKHDKLKIALAVAIVLAAAALAYSRPKSQRGGAVKFVRPIPDLYGARGGAQCTVKTMPPVQAGGGYKPYVVPDDLAVGGGMPDVPPVFEVPTDPSIEAIVDGGATLELKGDMF